MFAFWIAAAVLSAAAAGLVLARGKHAAAPGEDPAIAVHRRQLAEIDDLAERGLLAEGELKAARAEAGRRLLAAADKGEAATGDGRRLALIAAAATPLVAMALYFAVGQPGMADAPFAERLAAWRKNDPAQLDAPQMAAVLRAISAERPGDPEPLKHLALAELASGNPAAAEDALRRAIALAPERTDLQIALAELNGAPIRAMVEGLAARLEAEPDDPEGWVRLARAYDVLGETEKRDAALARAK